MSIIVRNDEENELDEVVAFNAYVHLERMDAHWFCLIIEQDGRRLMLNVGSVKRGKVKASIYADEIDTNGKRL